MENQRFRRLSVWGKAMDFLEMVYKVTRQFPKDETYGLISQLRRATLSIVLNIAEGSGADSDKEFNRFLSIALKSSYEVICGMEVAKRLQYGSIEEINLLVSRCDEVSAMISGLKKCLS